MSYIDAKYDLLINGEWVPAEGGETFETFNPATGESWPTVPMRLRPILIAPSKPHVLRYRPGLRPLLLNAPTSF